MASGILRRPRVENHAVAVQAVPEGHRSAAFDPVFGFFLRDPGPARVEPWKFDSGCRSRSGECFGLIWPVYRRMRDQSPNRRLAKAGLVIDDSLPAPGRHTGCVFRNGFDPRGGRPELLSFRRVTGSLRLLRRAHGAEAAGAQLGPQEGYGRSILARCDGCGASARFSPVAPEQTRLNAQR